MMKTKLNSNEAFNRWVSGKDKKYYMTTPAFMQNRIVHLFKNGYADKKDEKYERGSKYKTNGLSNPYKFTRMIRYSPIKYKPITFRDFLFATESQRGSKVTIANFNIMNSIARTKNCLNDKLKGVM